MGSLKPGCRECKALPWTTSRGVAPLVATSAASCSPTPVVSAKITTAPSIVSATRLAGACCCHERR
jgi:hypothetical protein